MNAPTHDEISERAKSLWGARGCPEGCDMEIWLEAERELSRGRPPAGEKKPETFTERTRAETAAESVIEYQISPAGTEDEAIQAAMPKPDFRAPKTKPRSS